MSVARLDALAVVDLDEIAVATRPLGAIHVPIGGGINRGADRAGNIHAGMHRCSAAEWIGADAVIAGEAQPFDWLGRRDRDHRLLERIELLPGHEQRAELLVGLQIDAGFVAVGGLERPTHCHIPGRRFR